MFERFTRAARSAVAGAVENAARRGSKAVGEGDLLLALLDVRGERGARVLAELGLTARRDAVAAALAGVRRRGGMTSADTEALASLGIDLTEVVRAVEAEHGAGALAAESRGRGGPRRRLSREAASVLERALRVAVSRRDRYIGAEHLLLALVTGRGAAAAVLADQGVTRAAVEAALTALPAAT